MSLKNRILVLFLVTLTFSNCDFKFRTREVNYGGVYFEVPVTWSVKTEKYDDFYYIETRSLMEDNLFSVEIYRDKDPYMLMGEYKYRLTLDTGISDLSFSDVKMNVFHQMNSISCEYTGKIKEYDFKGELVCFKKDENTYIYSANGFDGYIDSQKLKSILGSFRLSM